MKRNQLVFLMLFLLPVWAMAQTVTVTPAPSAANPSGNYVSLATAVSDVNASATNLGEVTIALNTGYAETLAATVTLNSGSGHYNSVKIYPTATGLSINGTVDGNPLIDLNGATNVTIDGRVNATGTASDLTIVNTSQSALVNTSTIRFINGASSNHIRYCIVKGSSQSPATAVDGSTAGGTLFFSTSTATTGNNNNVIDHNVITNAATASDTTRAVNSVYSFGTLGKENSNDTISNNDIKDFINPVKTATSPTTSTGINVSNNSTGWAISGNTLHETNAIPFIRRIKTGEFGYFGIYIKNAGANYTVSNNYIGGIATDANQTMAIDASFATPIGADGLGSVSLCGISIAVGATNIVSANNSIVNNIIQRISIKSTNSTPFTGIDITTNSTAQATSGINITGNTIGSTNDNGSITVIGHKSANTRAAAIGISSQVAAGYTGTCTITNNKIGSFDLNNDRFFFAVATALDFTGIKCSSGNITTISNNIIGSTTVPNSIHQLYIGEPTANDIQVSSPSTVTGISCTGAINSTYTMDGNTIANLTNEYLQDQRTNSTICMVGIQINVSAASTFSTKPQTITNNTIRDLTIYDNDESVAGGGQNTAANIGSTKLIGICYQNSSAGNSTVNNTISGNHIYNLISKGETFHANIAGIINQCFESLGTGATFPVSPNNITFSNNFIHDITVNPGATKVAGVFGIMELGGGTWVNNIISLGVVPQGSEFNANIYGIIEASANVSTTKITFNKLYHNTVYIGGTNRTNPAVRSYALYGFSATTSATAPDRNIHYIKNNIFVNTRSNPGNPGLNYATVFHYNADPSIPWTNTLNLDNNLYFVSSGGVLSGYFGSQTFPAANFPAVSITAQPADPTQWVHYTDAHTSFTDPDFANPGAGIPDAAIRYKPTIVLPVQTSNLDINTSITTDFAGKTRPASPTIGAYEFIPSTDATLSVLSVTAGTLTPAFDPGTTTYKVILATGVTVVPAIAATVNYRHASMVINQAAAIPGAGTVVVTAQDGSTKTYTLNFVWNDATLSSLSVNTGALTPAFDAQTKSYDVVLPYGTTDVPAIAATVNEIHATLVINKALSLPGTGTIVVTANDGTQMTYTVNFTIAPRTASSDATLGALSVSAGTLTPEFDPNTTTYSVVLPAGTTTVPEVTPTFNEIHASLNVTKATSLPGSTIIVVNAEDGLNQKTYTVNFSVLPSGDATLVSLSVSAGTLSPVFSTATTIYTVELPSETTEVPDVTAAVNETHASLSVSKANSLPGSTVITVTAQNNTIKIYTVNFTLAIPHTPIAREASTVTSSAFTANWDASAGATGYKIDVATNVGFTNMLGNYNNFGIASGTTTNLTVAVGVTANTTYYFRVRAYNSTGTSSSSEPVSVLTLSTPVQIISSQSLTIAVTAASINIESVDPIIAMQVTGITGKSIVEKSAGATAVSVSTEGWSSGVYILVLKTKKGVVTRKISIVK